MFNAFKKPLEAQNNYIIFRHIKKILANPLDDQIDHKAIIDIQHKRLNEINKINNSDYLSIPKELNNYAYPIQKIKGETNYYYKMKIFDCIDNNYNFSLYFIKWLPFCETYIKNDNKHSFFKLIDGDILKNNYDIGHNNLESIKSYSAEQNIYGKGKVKIINDNIGYIDNCKSYCIKNINDYSAYSLHLEAESKYKVIYDG